MSRLTPELSAERANRLCRMLLALGRKPRLKDTLIKKLKVEERSFFRDLATLRRLGIRVSHREEGYYLVGSLDDAISRLPVPDLKLSLRDALDLSEGMSPTQRKVRRQIEAMIGPVDFLDSDQPTRRAMIAH